MTPEICDGVVKLKCDSKEFTEFSEINGHLPNGDLIEFKYYQCKKCGKLHIEKWLNGKLVIEGFEQK